MPVQQRARGDLFPVAPADRAERADLSMTSGRRTTLVRRESGLRSRGPPPLRQTRFRPDMTSQPVPIDSELGAEPRVPATMVRRAVPLPSRVDLGMPS